MTPPDATPASERSRQVAGRVAYINARIIDPASGLDENGALLTEGDLVADFGAFLFADGVPEGIETVDCRGLCLCPGLVDMRVQLHEPGQEHKETIASGSAAAARGGVTSIACLPNTKPVIDSVALVGFIERRAREVGLVNIYPYAAVTRGLGGQEITEMGLLAAAGAIAFTDGFQAVADAQVMRRALSYSRSFDLLIVQHAEESSLAGDGVMNEGEVATRLGLSGIPGVAEAIILERDIRLVELTGGRYHAAHLSTAEGIEVVRRAKARGINITCDTAPPYFALNELAVGDYRTFARLSPPLRCEEDRLAVIEGLKDGTIDAIASDHAPHDQDSKRLPFAQAENGAVGLETLLAISLNLYHNKQLSLLETLKKLTSAAADILCLPAGRLANGAPADLLIFDPDIPWQIDASRFVGKSKNTPFDGQPTQGRAVQTIVAGQTAFLSSHFGARG